MSDEERESLKAELVDHVCSDLKSFEKVKLNVTVGVAISFLISFAYGIVVLTKGIDRLETGQTQLHADLNYKVSVGQFGKFAFKLQQDNPTLKVPAAPEAPESPHAAAASENAN